MARKVASRAGIAPFYVMQVMKAAGERAASGAGVLHLEVGQPSTGAPSPVVDAAVAALRAGPLHYTAADGTGRLRAQIAGWYAERYGVEVDPHRVTVTTGASGACVLAFLASFDAGDRVAVVRPGYPCYRNMLTAFGCEVVDVAVSSATRFQPTPELLDRTVAARGPLDGLVVASPSNPTGTMLGAAQLAALGSWCDANDVRLVVDEIYHGITYDAPAPTVLATSPDAIVVNSFSKYLSMTGWRLGWLVLPPDLVEPVERLAQNLTVAPPTLPQVAALEAFSPVAVTELDAHVARYARNRAVLLEGLAAVGFERIAPSDGAFYLWVDVSEWTDDAEKLCARWLDELALAVTPGIDFDPVDGHRYVRFSFAGSTDDVRAAVERLARWQR